MSLKMLEKNHNFYKPFGDFLGQTAFSNICLLKVKPRNEIFLWSDSKMNRGLWLELVGEAGVGS